MMDSKAIQIWEMSNQYVELALQHLALGAPIANKATPTTFDYAPEILRIRFLFPGIAEEGFNLLVSLRELRWRLSWVIRGDQVHQSIGSAHSLEQVEAMFQEKKSKMEDLLPRFSSVQQEIIEEKFFALEGSESESESEPD